MSTYVTMQGSLRYDSKAYFDQVVSTLKTGGWANEDGFFIDEMENPVCDDGSHEPDIDPVERTIDIPICHYRNIGRVKFFPPGTEGYIIGTCTDGCFEGWVNENGVETNYDLEKWAKENLEGDDAIAPQRSEYDTDADYGQNLCDWQQMVEIEFFGDMCP